MAPTMAHGVFGAGSGFRVGWRAMGGGGVWFLLFKGFIVVLAKLSFYRGDWGLGYHSMEFRVS